MDLIHTRIEKVRKHLKVSQEKFGERLGVSGAAISRLEKGDRNLTDQMMLAICREFNVNEEWLRTGKGEMFNEQDMDADLAFVFGKISAMKNDKLKKAMLSLTALTDEQLIFLGDFIQSLKGDTK